MSNASILFAIKILLFLSSALSIDYMLKNSPIGQHDEDASSAAPQISDLEMISFQPRPYTHLKAGNQVVLHNASKEFCGGTVLDARHVLTAAQCVYNLQPAFGPLYVVTSTGKVAAEAQMIFVPISFDEWLIFKTDIAVLKLDRDLPLGADGLGKPAELPKLLDTGIYDTYNDQVAVVVGHAAEPYESQNHSVVEPMGFPKKLLISKAELLPMRECSMFWTKIVSGMFEDPLCTRQLPGLSVQGHCKDYQGFGILINNTVIGVSSIGTAFCHNSEKMPYVATFFTRVSPWLPFIHAALADDTTSELLHSYTLVVNSSGSTQIEGDFFVVLWRMFVMIVASIFV